MEMVVIDVEVIVKTKIKELERSASSTVSEKACENNVKTITCMFRSYRTVSLASQSCSISEDSTGLLQLLQ